MIQKCTKFCLHFSIFVLNFRIPIETFDTQRKLDRAFLGILNFQHLYHAVNANYGYNTMLVRCVIPERVESISDEIVNINVIQQPSAFACYQNIDTASVVSFALSLEFRLQIWYCKKTLAVLVGSMEAWLQKNDVINHQSKKNQSFQIKIWILEDFFSFTLNRSPVIL